MPRDASPDTACSEVTGLNAVDVLRQGILAFCTLASILSDNGSCFVDV